MGSIYLRGHWHEERLLRYDPEARTSEVLRAQDLPRDRRYTVGRWQEVPEDHLFAVFASPTGPIFMFNDALEVPLKEATLEITEGRPKDRFRLLVRGVEVVNVQYTPQYGDNWFDREDFELPYWLEKHARRDDFIAEHTRSTPSPTWWLWLRDRFEYPPAPRCVDKTGTKIAMGYRELWRSHLLEALDDEGRDHFNEFILETADETGERALSLRGREADRAEMVKLRAWAKAQEGLSFALGRAHVALLEEPDPAGSILRIARDTDDPRAFTATLDRIAEPR